jgi:hypothetical protein
MTPTIQAVMDPTLWTGMSSCGPARLAARPTGGDWGWGCCSSAGWPHGCEADGWRLGLGVLQQRGVAAWLLASMALAVATGG